MSNTQIAIDAVRLLEVLENENAALQAMLEKCNSKFIVGLEAENAALREEIRELNQMGFTHQNAAAQKAALDAATTEECAEPVAVVYVANPIPEGTHGRWMSWLVNPVNLANKTKLYASAPNLEAKIAAKLEIEKLRWYGNKDCTHQADEELRRLGYPL